MINGINLNSAAETVTIIVIWSFWSVTDLMAVLKKDLTTTLSLPVLPIIVSSALKSKRLLIF
jgi:hypothetical protein